MHIKTLAILAPFCLATALTACDQRTGPETAPGNDAPAAGGKADEVDADEEPSLLGAACLYSDDCGEEQYCALMACALEGEHPTAEGDLSFCYGQCVDAERPRQCLLTENNSRTREWVCPGEYECASHLPRDGSSTPEYCDNTVSCSSDADCADAGEGWECNVNGICGEPCSTRDDCQAAERCALGVCLGSMERADTPPSVSIPVLLDNPDYFEGRNVGLYGYYALDGATCNLEFEDDAVEVLIGTLSDCRGSRHRLVYGSISVGDDGVPAIAPYKVHDSVCSPNPANWNHNRGC